MKDQLQTIRSKLSPIADGDWDNEMYVIDRAKQALAALSELERLAGEPWIQWPGGAYPPIDDDAVFEYFTMNGEHHGPTSSASRLDWKDDYRLSDIIAYRLCAPPAQQPQYEAADMASAAAQGFRDGVASVAQQPQAEAVPVHQCTGAGDTALGTKSECSFCSPQQAEAAPVILNICRLITPDEYADAVERFRHKASRDKETFKDDELAAFVAHLLNLAKSRIKTAPQQAEAVPVCKTCKGEGGWEQPQAEAITEAVIDAYLEDYEMIGEAEDGRDACYAPSEGEKALIKDAIMGLLAEAPTKQPQAEAVPLDMGAMELAESVGLIGPASRTDDFHAAIQRFHDLISMNVSIKAAVHFAQGLPKKGGAE